MSTTPDELQKAYRSVAALVVVVVFAGVATISVRAAYGAFADDIVVTAEFARAGQALKSGSDVKYRGVNVGTVRSVELDDRRVRVRLQLERRARVPVATVATVRPKTLFGEKFVELSVVDGDPAPYLADGDELAPGQVGTDLEQLLAGTDGLLREIDIDDVAVLMDELTRAAHGEGDTIARLLDRSVAATAVITDTLDAQLRAVDSARRFARQYRDVGPTVNAIGANLNELLPTFNAARADYERLLVTLRPFADALAELIDVNEADLGTLLDNGDNIVRVLTARQDDIADTIHGLSVYMQAFAGAFGEEQLPDGSRFGYLKVFIETGDLSALLCNTLGPTGTAAELAAVLEALAAVAPVLACGPGGASAGSDPTAAFTDGVTGVLASPDESEADATVADLLAPATGGAG